MNNLTKGPSQGSLAFDVVSAADTHRQTQVNLGVVGGRKKVVEVLGGDPRTLPTIPDITRADDDFLKGRTTHGTILALVVKALRTDGAQAADNFEFVMKTLQLTREQMGKLFGYQYNRGAMSGKDVAERFRMVFPDMFRAVFK